MVGFEKCEICGENIPKQPKPVRQKYGGHRLCDKCKRDVLRNMKIKADSGEQMEAIADDIALKAVEKHEEELKEEAE